MSKSPDDLVCDFVGGAVGHRLKYGGGRRQALPKAIGFKSGHIPSVVDATAGLGRDAFLLASLGAQVTLIERNPHMHRLLHEGLNRAMHENEQYAEIIRRMTLLHGDARDLLPTLNPDVVLIDPMHPPRQKSALVKKEMRLIRDIVGTDPDARELLEIALACARSRVVLKWPMRAEPMDGIIIPSHQITGKSTRYDVFIRT
ncbi:MAG: class I SAM-dependent methyltransferase [Alphaproteobacteria bacterium]|nr:class I SAM-dependent methyltransferase [Alphaproteobacteria bacterium]HPF46211.1 class I SAM-dependent methyltransferase [Emcibacteraceae bacterium]HRW30121.1 class I SAM-dependent methyltransferase [Emcibacteraceae bacterium]